MDEQRITYIASQIVSVWIKTQPAIVVMEGYSFNSKSSSMHLIHELGGVVKHYFSCSEAAFIIKTPVEIKQFATGKGNATKEEMIAAAQKMWKQCPSNDNVADAFHGARYGFRKYQQLVGD